MVRILETPLPNKAHQMQTRDTIEDLVTRELDKFCTMSVHADACIDQKPFDHEGTVVEQPSRGLCTMCDHASHCKLPGRQEGVWRCNEFL
jgi:hypothetical protein